MEPVVVGIIGIVAMFVLLMMGMHIGFTLIVIGFFGFASLTSFPAAISLLKTVPFATSGSYTLSVVPLFVLMGQFAFYSQISQELYDTSYKWLSRLPGGLAVATIGACAGFAAICGSSPATAATMGTVAYPEMKKYGYADSLSTGCIAAGGTLGILIPPSVGFILYAVIAEESVGRLFAAGVIPGILLACFFGLAVVIQVLRKPNLAPDGPAYSWAARFASLKDLLGVLLLFILVIGGIFSGLFTPNEAAGAGAFLTLIIMAFRKRLTWDTFSRSMLETAQTTGMLFLIVIGAYLFGYFLAITQIPTTLADTVASLNISRELVLVLILAIYILLGCILDSLAMIVLTVPIFLPVMKTLGYDPIWFGVIMVMVMEMGLITPPVGMNVYVINGVTKDVPLHVIFRGITPFLMALIACVALVSIFPSLALFLPNLLYH